MPITMSPAIRSLVIGSMLTAALLVADPGVTQNAAAPPSSLPCLPYDSNVFLSDPSIASILQLPPGPGRKTVQLPCTENVSGKAVQAANPVNERTAAAQGSLNSLFDETRTPLERFQNGFDFYSWLTFIALNSPQDQNAAFGEPGAKTFWEETFYPLDQVMHLSESQENFHLKFDSEKANLPQTCEVAQIEAQKKRPTPPEPTLFVTVDDVAFDQPFKTGPLIDQQGHYSLNTIFMSPEMRGTIKSKGLELDSYASQQKFHGTINFPAGKGSVFGSMMIKASWRELTPADDVNEFHTAWAYRYVPSTGACTIAHLGLVGFHVVHKTANRHQWIWTTFEHVRNVPSVGDLKSGHLLKAYFFYNAADKLRPDNQPPDHPWDPARPTAKKSQIVRAQDISEDTQTINKAAQAFLAKLNPSATTENTPPLKRTPRISNVWTHYQLISTQWPADFNCASEEKDEEKAGTHEPRETNQQADPNCSPAPQFLPNSTLETYIQHDIATSQHDIGTSGGMPQSTSSCIACHNNAVAYINVDYKAAQADCKLDLLPTTPLPLKACSPASDFTFILEQVCAPMVDAKTGHPECLRDH